MDRLLDAFADGESSEAEALRVREHVEGCPPCRRELRLRSRLKLKIIDGALTPAPDGLKRRIVAALDRADRESARPGVLRWSIASAAGILLVFAALLLFPSRGDAAPALIRQAAEFHDRCLDAAVRADSPEALRAYFRDTLKLDVVVPTLKGGSVVGGCPCNLPNANASPWIVYRKGGTPISLLAIESDHALPDSAKRTVEGRPYWTFTCGRNTVVACRAGRLWHLWIARMTERELLDAALQTREGRQAFAGERLTLRGLT